MQDTIMLNGKPRCTLIQKFNGEVVVIGPNASSHETFSNVGEAEAVAVARGWAMIIHPTLKNQEAST